MFTLTYTLQLLGLACQAKKIAFPRKQKQDVRVSLTRLPHSTLREILYPDYWVGLKFS